MKNMRGIACCVLLTVLSGCAAPVLPLAERMEQIWHDNQFPVVLRGSVDDAHFLRRIFFDLTGRPPAPAVITAFMRDPDPQKRVRMTDQLLMSDEFAVYQAHLWGDELRIKAEFPINLWPNAVQLYSRYVYESVRDNKPYDVWARELLTSSGSDFRIPPANFFRASADRSPKGLAAVTCQTFLGCPLAALSVEEQKNFIPFFSRIGYKSSKEWKEEFVYCKYPAPGEPALNAAVPGREMVCIPADRDPRCVLADELLASPRFDEAMVDRVWRRLFGRPLSDSRLALMKREMGQRFRASGYNIRNLYREILLSPAYSLPPGTPEQEKIFAAYPIRRMNAEQISDRLSFFLKQPFETYSSVIPEPFTFLPRGTPACAIDDGSISSSFLDLMGKPPRDSGAPDERHDQLTGKQKLFLLNSGNLYNRLWRVPNQWSRPRDPFPVRVNSIYLAALSRPATLPEIRQCQKYMNAMPRRQRGRFWRDLVWSLINSKEFIYQF